jgi:hypothetical protein
MNEQLIQEREKLRKSMFHRTSEFNRRIAYCEHDSFGQLRIEIGYVDSSMAPLHTLLLNAPVQIYLNTRVGPIAHNPRYQRSAQERPFYTYVGSDTGGNDLIVGGPFIILGPSKQEEMGFFKRMDLSWSEREIKEMLSPLSPEQSLEYHIRNYTRS